MCETLHVSIFESRQILLHLRVIYRHFGSAKIAVAKGPTYWMLKHPCTKDPAAVGVARQTGHQPVWGNLFIRSAILETDQAWCPLDGSHQMVAGGLKLSRGGINRQGGGSSGTAGPVLGQGVSEIDDHRDHIQSCYDASNFLRQISHCWSNRNCSRLPNTTFETLVLLSLVRLRVWVHTNPTRRFLLAQLPINSFLFILPPSTDFCTNKW
jgi:hypothetical protein